jgi:hypothetical protein
MPDQEGDAAQRSTGGGAAQERAAPRSERLFKCGRDPVVVLPWTGRLAARAPRHGVQPAFFGLPHLDYSLGLSGVDPVIDLRLPATKEWRESLRNLRAVQERVPWAPKPSTKRGGYTAKPWTAEEDEAIRLAHAELERRIGYTQHLYARFLQHLGDAGKATRTPGGVAARCKILHGKRRRRNSDEAVYR